MEEQGEKEQPRLDKGQYAKLIECSKKGPEGIDEWKKWRGEKRTENPKWEIWLQGAKLFAAKLQKAYLESAELQETHLVGANLEGAYLKNAKLQEANLEEANLKGAYLAEADLQSASLNKINLQGTDLWKAKLQGAEFGGAIVDGFTSFLACEIDEDTDFRYMSLENMRIESDTKILLKYNIRRMNWQDWYEDHCFLQWPVKLFWLMSDYGRSTGRIMFTFLALATAFAFVYYLWPCCVIVNNEVGEIRGFVHALYFSVVTMTTLGFGDIAANPDSWPGQVVLMVQVILGYVLLGALVTRLAVLFTSDGPAGKFTPMTKETKKFLAKLKEDKEKTRTNDT